MRPWRAFWEVVHLVVLGLWLGTVVMAGATAAVVFPTMKALDPVLPEYAAYTGEHWRIAGGQVGQRVFLISDVVQFSCAVVALGTLAGSLVAMAREGRRPRLRGVMILRALALGIAIAGVAGEVIVLAPTMNTAARAYWTAAAMGDMASAQRHRDAFAQMHPIATGLLTLNAVAVLMALASAAWGMATADRAGVVRSADGSTAAGSRWEEPALLRIRP